MACQFPLFLCRDANCYRCYFFRKELKCAHVLNEGVKHMTGLMGMEVNLKYDLQDTETLLNNLHHQVHDTIWDAKFEPAAPYPEMAIAYTREDSLPQDQALFHTILADLKEVGIVPRPFPKPEEKKPEEEEKPAQKQESGKKKANKKRKPRVK